MSIQLFNGDCIEVMKDIPDSSIDMVLCDLPYGKTHLQWDCQIDKDLLWVGLYRIVKKNGAIVLFCQEPFTSELVMSNRRDYRQKLTWLKTRPTNVFNARKQFMNWTEDILVFYRELPTFNPQMRTDGAMKHDKVQHTHTDREKGVFNRTGEKEGYVYQFKGKFYPKTVVEFSNVNNHKNLHPTQKPVELCEWLIKTYTNEGETVLDSTMGSGSIGVACVNTNRNFIGIELDKKYFDIAKQRIEASKIKPRQVEMKI